MFIQFKKIYKKYIRKVKKATFKRQNIKVLEGDGAYLFRNYIELMKIKNILKQWSKYAPFRMFKNY
jgi:hypothetical protein